MAGPLRAHHAARRLSSSQRRAERFAYISKLEEHGDLEEDDGSVDIEGQDGLGEQDALERQERALHAVALDSLQDVLFREAEWARALAGRCAGDAEMGKDDANEEDFAPAPEMLDPFLVT